MVGTVHKRNQEKKLIRGTVKREVDEVVVLAKYANKTWSESDWWLHIKTADSGTNGSPITLI